MVSFDGVKSSTVTVSLTGHWHNGSKYIPQETWWSLQNQTKQFFKKKPCLLKVFPETDRSYYLPSHWLGCQYVKIKQNLNSVEVNVVWKAIELTTSVMRSELLIACLVFKCSFKGPVFMMFSESKMWRLR